MKKPSEIAEEEEQSQLAQHRPPEVARYYALLAALDHLAEMIGATVPEDRDGEP